MLYNKILEVNPNNASAWTSLGHCYSMLNDNFSALKAYQQAMSVSEGEAVQNFLIIRKYLHFFDKSIER